MFKPPEDIRYLRFLRRLHEQCLFDWYMEIGCRTGRTFANVRAKTIAVDPYFQLSSDVMGAKPALFLFQQTSDDFFAADHLNRIGARLSFSFLDGMHLFEFLLRDFINTERNSHPDGVIALHDCCPVSVEMTTRDLKNLPPGDWTGDVWKLIPILQRHRPDLKITVLGCKPTGLVLVSGLDPENRTLAKEQDGILADWRDVPFDDYGVARFYDLFEYAPARQMLNEGLDMFRGVCLDATTAPVPEWVTP